jgi:hypothetical protein
MHKDQPGWSATHEPALPTSRAASPQERGVLAILRALMPRRLLTTREGELIAELQANRLLELAGLPQAPVPTELITELPRIAVRVDPTLPVSGSAQWVSGRWLLSINGREPWTRQRFSLAHELKHVLDHPYVDVVYAGNQQAEYLADYFAACLLMPRRYVKRAWSDGVQSLGALSAHFGVSERAMAVRLQYLDLRPPLPRHGPSAPTSRRRPNSYQRALAPVLEGAAA